ncbi:ribosomal-protein-S18-alanine N-acetyltransferase [Campylobacter blaseri]|uniref:GNAT family N-acetyltransferase n=1 Tax=Campylobacter blaseri TaxID=2042961 RepID=A0A2P8R421_9BACT|nr:GNAT family N-acetyltransferase [Campylobacter blaseri]PSM53251.1 GNAT family N-acetyltransferase [Campylobacter blaseri]PSM54717.1 GNAT family N-acetyltransferase [Campylobacter blaseri]QKF86799.1 ribosomal-protein-S18-alanine N-acetyltransferase [Campylobacter blaseri]
MKIRLAHSSDVKRLLEIENRVFSKDEFALSKANFYYHIRKNLLYVSVGEKDEILGYILVFNKLKIPRIYSFAVAVQHQGIGSKLLNFVCDKFEALQLEVRADNFNAIRLYGKFGFKKYKILKAYYPDGADGIKMKKL